MQLRLRRSQHIFAALIVVALASCSSDEESAPTAACGNGKVEGNELCDGKAFGATNTCSKATMGMKSTGTLKCSPTCTLDPSGCTGGGTSGAGGGGGMGTGGAGAMAGGGGASGSDAGKSDAPADVSSDGSPTDASQDGSPSDTSTSTDAGGDGD